VCPEGLSQCEAGHHYPGADEDQVVVEVSKGEYGDDWWHAHGNHQAERPGSTPAAQPER